MRETPTAKTFCISVLFVYSFINANYGQSYQFNPNILLAPAVFNKGGWAKSRSNESIRAFQDVFDVGLVPVYCSGGGGIERVLLDALFLCFIWHWARVASWLWFVVAQYLRREDSLDVFVEAIFVAT